MDYWIVFIVVAVVVITTSVIMYRYTTQDSLSTYFNYICLFNLIMSCIWIWFACQIIIDLFKVASIILKFKNSFLFMFVLPIGNLIPEFIFQIKLARRGYESLIQQAIIGRKPFYMILCFGLALLIRIFS